MTENERTCVNDADKGAWPLVTIGLPVYNGATYIEEALVSLGKIRYPNYEIIISDNASTDETRQICERIQKSNDQVSYFRNEQNLGASRNFQNLAQMAKGPYFMWAGCHDKWEPEILEQCVAQLESDKDLALVYPDARWVDEKGNKGNNIGARMRLCQQNALLRIVLALWRFDYHAIYGVHRSSIIKQATFREGCFAPDWLCVLEIAGHGHIMAMKDTLLYMRRDAEFANWRVYFSKLKLPFCFSTCVHLLYSFFTTIHGILRSVSKNWLEIIACKFICIATISLMTQLIATMALELFFPKLRKQCAGKNKT